MSDELDRPGLRERKKQETRAKLIEAAIDLVDKQGYERTTVGQIAEAVEVSPRTVAHYFPSKDKLLLSVVDAYFDALLVQLAQVPDDVPPFRSLFLANLAVLDSAPGQNPPIVAEHLIGLLRTVHISPPLKPQAVGLRSVGMSADVSRRLGTAIDDWQVEMVIAVWTAIVTISWSGVNMERNSADTGPANLLAMLRDRLTQTYAEFMELTAGLVPSTG